MSRPLSLNGQLAQHLHVDIRVVRRMGGYEKILRMDPVARAMVFRDKGIKMKKLPSIAVVKDAPKAQTDTAMRAVSYQCSVPSCPRWTYNELCERHTRILRQGCDQRVKE
jgi:hypothetical protein